MNHVLRHGSLVLLFLVVSVLSSCAEDDPVRVKSSLNFTWSERIPIASGKGIRGPWRMNRSNFQYVDDPNADVTPDGAVGVAWVDQERQDIFFQRYDSERNSKFDDPVNVSNTPDVFSWFPKVVISDEHPNHIYVLWQEIVFSGGSHGGEAFFARSTDGGKTFEEPINLSRSEAGDGKGRLTEKRWDNGSLDLVEGPQGHLYAAWTEYEGRLWLRRSTSQGKQFEPPILVNDPADQPPARGPSLAVSSPETVHVAWTAGNRPAADVHLRSVDPERREQNEIQRVCRSEGHSDAPKIALDEASTLHLVYGESPTGPLETYHIRYCRSSDGGMEFTESKTISRTPDPYVGANYPALAAAGDRSLYVVWERFEAGSSLPDQLAITYSSDGGRTFVTPEAIPNTSSPPGGFNGSQQGQLMGKLAVNANGDVVVVNSNFVRNEQSKVYFLRGHRNSDD